MNGQQKQKNKDRTHPKRDERLIYDRENVKQQPTPQPKEYEEIEY